MTRKPRRGKKGSESCLGNQLSIIGHEGAALAQKGEILYEVTFSLIYFYNLNIIRLGNWATLITFSRFKFDKPEDAVITFKSNW